VLKSTKKRPEQCCSCKTKQNAEDEKQTAQKKNLEAWDTILNNKKPNPLEKVYPTKEGFASADL